MARLLRSWLPTPATVIATVAVVVALTGTAYAATVGTQDIEDGAVTTPKLAPAAVKGAKIAAGAVHAIAIAQDAVGSAEIAAGAVGASEIATGAVSSSELAGGSVDSSKIGTEAVRASELAPVQEWYESAAIDPGSVETLTALCPIGSQIVSGGHYASSSLVFNVASRRSGNGWYAQFRNTSGSEQTIYTYAYCLVS